MPQMSPLLWSVSIIFTISLLLSIISFMYFLIIPAPSNLSFFPRHLPTLPYIWLW